jgi:hypothetical protein
MLDRVLPFIPVNQVHCGFWTYVVSFPSPNAQTQVPLILPGIMYDTELTVRSIDPSGAADQLEIFVCNPKSSVPAISAILKMPVSEIVDA